MARSDDPNLPGFGAPPGADADYVAPGSQATHEWGVQYQGTFESETDGTSRAVRLHARALNAAGVPVLLQSVTGKFRARDGSIQNASATSERVKDEIRHLRYPSIRALKVRVKHAVIQHADFLRAAVIPRSVAMELDPEVAQAQMSSIYATTIVYSVWERTIIDPNIIGILRRVAECWVPSEHNRKLLYDHGVERVTVVPHPWEASSPLVLGERGRITGKRFYAIGIWQPRKGFHELLGAFLHAFKPTDDAWLTIKYQEFNWPDYPTPMQSIEHWLALPGVRANGWKPELLGARISLIDKYLSEEALARLHLENNIYVSASHGEAYNLGAFDAKLCGNRLIHVPWGGTADFDDEADVRLSFHMEPVPASYRWDAGAEWASLDFRELAAAMFATRAPEHFTPNGRVAWCSFENVGRLMKERVEAVLRRASELA